jgi:ATP-binding cassette, subfamily B, bacterial
MVAVPARGHPTGRSSAGSRTLRRLVRLLRSYRATALLLSIAVAVGTGAELLPSILMQHIVDDVLAPGGSFRLLAWLVCGFLAARILIAAADVGRGWLSVWLGARVAADLRRSLHSHLQRLPLHFFTKWPVGVLMSHVITDAGRVEEFIANTVPLLGVNVLMLTGILVFLFHASWRLALWALVPVPLILIAAALLWSRLKLALDRQASAWSGLSGVLVESLGGIRIIKAFSQEEREARRFDERNDRVMDATVMAERRSFVLFSVIYFLMSLGVFLAWYVGGREVIRGSLHVGVLMAVIALLWMFYWPLQWLGQVAGSAGQAMIGAARAFEILDTTIEPYDDPTALPMRRADGSVSFRDVTFGYEPDQPVLREIEFHANPGEMIGIVGRSGAGKTTLVNLLCRFYDVDQGAIEIDGIDIRKIRLEDLRSQIGVVAQDPFLFGGTVAENIRFGRPTASFDEVMEAARAAHAHPFIMMMPEAYDTDIGECGRRLSGGEKQRIAIARAILRDPRILILDEATSQLDTRSEAAIQEALGILARNRTTFVVAHRLTTIHRADRILVLDHGRIVDSGSHQTLMARQTLYSQLVTTQRDMRILVTGQRGQQ